MKTLDQWTDRLEELVHEEAWLNPPTGELPTVRAARRLVDELLVEIVSEKIARPIAEAMIAELQERDRPSQIPRGTHTSAASASGTDGRET